MATHHPIRKSVPAAAPVIPDKLYFRIGDVARLLEVPAYVLRFWETEFPQLKPNKGGTGQRLYRRRDVEMALRIKSLLYDQGYTIPGARQVFKAEAARTATPEARSATPEARSAAPEPGRPETAEAPEAVTLPAASAPRPLAAVAPPAAPYLSKDTLLSLRAELSDLLTLLANPVSGAHPPVEPRLAPMRPRLVLEPRPARLEKTDKPERPRLQLHQPGLFGFDDPGPAAS